MERNTFCYLFIKEIGTIVNAEGGISGEWHLKEQFTNNKGLKPQRRISEQRVFAKGHIASHSVSEEGWIELGGQNDLTIKRQRKENMKNEKEKIEQILLSVFEASNQIHHCKRLN